jgi:hypothetical protein
MTVLSAAKAAGALVPLHPVSDQPEHRRPQADEERAALGVPAFLLVNCLGANPEPDAEQDGAERAGVEVPPTQAGLVNLPRKHQAPVPG